MKRGYDRRVVAEALMSPSLPQSLANTLSDPALDRATILPVGRRTFTDPGDDITEERSLEFALPGLLYDPLMGAARVSDMFAGAAPIDPNAVTQFMIDAPFAAGALSAATGAAPKGAVLGANVFHGGPHRFAPEPDFPHGRPRLDKIGTGEGNQAYGYGFYSADAPGVATAYRDNLQRMGKPSVKDRTGSFSELLSKYYPASEGKYSQQVEANGLVFQGPDQIVDGIKGGLIKEGDVPDEIFSAAQTFLEPGTLYKLDIPDADVAKYLDYDKPLSEQPKSVRDALRPLLMDPSNPDYIPTPIPDNMPGYNIYKVMSETLGGDQAASEVLRKAGIPGLKYFDADSRNRGRTATVDGTPIKQFNTEDYDLNNLLQKIEQGYSVGDVRKMAEGKRGLAAKFDALEIKINDGTRNYVTWDQDVLNRSKMLERDGQDLAKVLMEVEP